jgi:hypothetical protein
VMGQNSSLARGMTLLFKVTSTILGKHIWHVTCEDADIGRRYVDAA